MIKLRSAVIALFLGLVAYCATVNPLVAALLFVGGCALISDTRSGCLGAITVPAGLKLDRILNTALIALKRRLLPLMAFSVVHRDVMLQGTDIVRVPFVPLDQTASLDYDDNIGYEEGDGTIESRPVTINKRKYQTLSFTSQQLARQPILELEQILVAKTNQLAEDVIADIFSAVTAANYGAAAYTGAASAFDSDDIVAVRKVCADAMWPETGRALVVNNTMDLYVMSDDNIKQAYAFGGSEGIREGRVARLLGFDYYSAPILPDNSENLLGFVSLPSAMLVAFSPIEPAEEVLNLMTDYRAVSDPETGLTLEYRAFGNAQGDKVTRIVECNYGYAVGDAAQLKRLVSA